MAYGVKEIEARPGLLKNVKQFTQSTNSLTDFEKGQEMYENEIENSHPKPKARYHLTE